MKCARENCEDKATFEIKNFRKEEQLFFCDLHFWQYCTECKSKGDLHGKRS